MSVRPWSEIAAEIMNWSSEPARRVALSLVAAAGLPCEWWEAGSITPWAIDWTPTDDGRRVRLLLAADGEWQLLFWDDGENEPYPAQIKRGALEELPIGSPCEALERLLFLAGAP